MLYFFFSSRRRHTRWTGDWSSDVCSSDLIVKESVPRASWRFARELAASSRLRSRRGFGLEVIAAFGAHIIRPPLNFLIDLLHAWNVLGAMDVCFQNRYHNPPLRTAPGRRRN